MKKWLWLLLCLTLGANAERDDLEVVGRAYDVSGERFLYLERHRWRGQEHLVQFFDPDGELIAENRLRYERASSEPAHDQIDHRSGRREGARWDGDRLYLFRDERERRVEPGEPLVISSGFEPFVRSHWSELTSGESLRFDFAVAGSLRTLGLAARSLPQADCQLELEDGWVCFRVEAASRLFRWLSDPIDLAYDEQRRLRTYRGLSNLRDERGDSLSVLIRYEYRDAGDDALASLCERDASAPRFC